MTKAQKAYEAFRDEVRTSSTKTATYSGQARSTSTCSRLATCSRRVGN